MVWKVRHLPPTFACGIAIPARLQLLCDGKPVDLRIPARRGNPFWERFSDTVFSRTEMVAAIHRIVRGDTRSVIASMRSVPRDVPEEVDAARILKLQQDFEQVGLGICRDSVCISRTGFSHAHAYRCGEPIKLTAFRDKTAVRAWINANKARIDSLNEIALRNRLRDWPGLPEHAGAGAPISAA